MMKVCQVFLAVICVGAALAVDQVVHGGQNSHAARSAIGGISQDHAALNKHAHSGQQTVKAAAGHQNNLQHNGYGKNEGYARLNNGYAQADDDQSYALYDTLSNTAANEAIRNANSAFKDGQYKQNNAANKAGFNQANAQKKSYNTGKVLNDNISYGFDKKFDKHSGEKGGFEEELGNDSHKLDEFRTRERALNLHRGQHAANKNSADAKKALRESKFNKNAANKALQNSKYANKDNRVDKAQKRADLQDIAYDKKDKRFRASQKGKDESVRKFDDFNVKDDQFNKNSLSDAHGKRGELAQNQYKDGKNGIIGAAGAHGAHGAHGVDGHGAHGAGRAGAGIGGASKKKSALYGESAKHAQNLNNHNARKAGKHAAALNDYQRAKDLYDTNQIKSLRDSRRGNLKNALHNSANGGFNNKNASAAKSASAINRQYADAAARKTANQARKDLDEAKFDKENSKRVLSDRHQKQRKLKRFFHDKQAGGNNFERLNFNRKRIQSDFGNQQAAAAQSGKKFNVAHNQHAFSEDKRTDSSVHARQAKATKGKKNKAASSNGHHKKSNSKAAKSAVLAEGYKHDAGKKTFQSHDIAAAEGRHGLQQSKAQNNGAYGHQNIGGTHGNGGFSNFGNFHSFGNNGFGINPVKQGRTGYQGSHAGNFGGFGFGNSQKGFANGRFAPFKFTFANYKK